MYEYGRIVRDAADFRERVHHSGGSLCYSSIMNNERALLQAATRYYGTWEAAVNATGLVYDNYRTVLKWNNSLFFASAVGYLADGMEER